MESKAACGLTSAEALQRAQAGQLNQMPKSKEGGVGEILRRHVLTFFNLLNCALAALLLWVGSYRNLLFMGVVLSNALIGVVQELRAKRTHDRLRLLSEGKITTLRDGAALPLPPGELVLGDVVILSRGDQAPADGVVLEGDAHTDESILTGESAKIGKAAGDTVYSGSFLVDGRLAVRLTAVGGDSYMGRLQTAARKVKRASSVLMGDMNRIIRYVSMALIPLGLLLYLKQRLFLNLDHTGAVVKTVAAMIGMIPEGLILLTSVSLAAGVVALGQKQTLVNELYGIESLARTDVLCMDKTGTLTSGQMAFDRCVPAPGVEAEAISQSLSALLGALGSDGPTAVALAAAYPPVLHRPAELTVPFSSQRKWSLAYFADLGSVALGAPERLLTGELLIAAQAYAAKGLRVVALAQSSQRPGEAAGEPVLPSDLRPMAFFGLSDALRPQVKETIRYFIKQGVALKVLSGDSPLTVSCAAQSAGIPGAERLIDLSALEGEKDYAALSRQYTVFGRVSPGDKRELVAAMQRDGHSVAMVGDGVNDIPALKTADCSLAMAGGSEAACRVAQMTLLSGGFDAMPQILLEGRRVINNITRASALFLIKNIYSMLLTAALIFLPFAYPFAPIQLTLISTLTIGGPSFLLALQPSRERVKGDFMRNVIVRALPGGLCAALLLLTAMFLKAPLGLNEAQLSTLCTLAAGFSGLTALTLTCLPLNKLRGGLIVLMAALMGVGVLGFPSVFYLVALPKAALWALGGLCAAAPPLQLGLKALADRFQRKGAKRQKKDDAKTPAIS